MEESKEGILILGTPRSGTTLLRRFVNAHPNIACPGETNLFTACSRFLHSERIAEDVEIGVLSGLGHAGFENATVIDRLREFAFDFHREHALQQGKKRWAEKTAFDSFYIDQIEKLCGDRVHYVCVVRNGFDFVMSMQELCTKNQAYLAEVHQYVCKYSKPLVAFAHCWVDLTNRVLQLVEKQGSNSILIKYEDLVSNVEQTLANVFAAIGEELDDTLVESALGDRNDLGFGDWKGYGLKKVETKSVGRASELSPRTMAELAQIMNPTIEACGYEPHQTPAPATDGDDAQRRYELGLLIAGMRENEDQQE